ncbi:MAG TPA: class I SAM-dependent methyltransferase [Trebonia sp.]|jgi:methylase of polypeptide subunit release factors|nr:class I SAM-dependent methyltransferase [Trebonia sp.]
MENDPHGDAAAAWHSEYERQGIPSSHRDEPSGVVRWALANVPFLTDKAIAAAVDLGCGTGRNAIALASQWQSYAQVKRVEAMDFSLAALDVAQGRPGAANR